ncbi:3-keto-disaccharide hydrolase [Eudoraea sp.]|uniref:3-keto-disaccharide hydrolase n=1 Tax=Eudoraea sp. TaxID=1979955 RepID=UPI003C78B8DC
MKLSLKYTIILLLSLGSINPMLGQETKSEEANAWFSLFNGKDLDGWKVGVNASTFSVEDGTIKVAGDRAHLFYAGDVENHNFKNFEFKARVMTKPGANSGIYIHTRYQEDGWPTYGYEVQVNNSQGDWKRTGSLYNIVDVKENYAADNEWYTEYVKVEGKRIIVKINDIVVVDYTEPENPLREGDGVHRVLKEGTFALQGHDPGSVVFYKDIMVRPLP